MKHKAAVLAVITLAIVAATGCNKGQTLARDAGAAEARVDSLVIPDGTSVVATLDMALSTESNRTGDLFTMTTIEPIAIEGRTALPSGVRISGVLEDVQASDQTVGRARMTLAYEKVTDMDGMSLPITAEPLELLAESAAGIDVEHIATGGVIGAVIGAVATNKGAVVDAGAGSGSTVMVATRGRDVVLEAGQKVSVRMTSPMVIQILARK